MNRVCIGSDNGLSPIRCQAIILTNTGLLPIGRLATNFTDILLESNFFIKEYAFGNGCEMTAILFRRRWVTYTSLPIRSPRMVWQEHYKCVYTAQFFIFQSLICWYALSQQQCVTCLVSIYMPFLYGWLIGLRWRNTTRDSNQIRFVCVIKWTAVVHGAPLCVNWGHQKSSCCHLALTLTRIFLPFRIKYLTSFVLFPFSIGSVTHVYGEPDHAVENNNVIIN